MFWRQDNQNATIVPQTKAPRWQGPQLHFHFSRTYQSTSITKQIINTEIKATMPLRQFWCHLGKTMLYYNGNWRDQTQLSIKWRSKILTMFFLAWADKNSVVNFFHLIPSAYNLSYLCLSWWQNNQLYLLPLFHFLD